jgi:uncharacterized membrane protein
MNDNIIKLINDNMGKVVGGFLGLLVALIIVAFGFWKGVFIILCIVGGKYEGVRNFLERIWPFRE